MKVLFKNSQGVKREIAEVNSKQEALNEIQKFCTERNFHVSYFRQWKQDEYTTKVDVGSWTEFFYIIKEE